MYSGRVRRVRSGWRPVGGVGRVGSLIDCWCCLRLVMLLGGGGREIAATE